MTPIENVKLLLDEVIVFLNQLEKSGKEIPEVFDNPYNMIYMILETLEYRDNIYTNFILSGVPPEEAAQKTTDHLNEKAKELLESNKNNVIPFKERN